jgi:hypothetical protein
MHRVSFDFKISGVREVGVFLSNSNSNAILRHSGDVDFALGGDDVGDAVQMTPQYLYLQERWEVMIGFLRG